MNKNRRNFLERTTSLAAVISVAGLSACSGSSRKDSTQSMDSSKSASDQKVVEWPIIFGPNAPKLGIGVSRDADQKRMQQAKQIGADYVFMGGPQIPWTEDGLRAILDRFKAEGLSVINMMIGGYPNTIFGREGRDEEIKHVQDSLRAAGAVGLPVVEYNFYAHRLMEGYYEMKGRGGSGITAFDYERGTNLPNDPGVLQTSEMLWDSLNYFLKAVIPVAEKAGVRMALHPNDPPIPISHGQAQIMTTFKDWKHLLDLVDSPSNGMTFDCGVSREIGEDPLEVFRYLISRDRVNHMHYRNVMVQQPHVKYQEVFFDAGQVNMFAMMREVFKSGYTHGIYPEHPRGLDYDNEHPGGIRNIYPGGGGYTGQAYNIAYTKAMMQAVASL